MVGHDILCHIKPEFGHLGKDSSLFADLVGKYHVKAADPVSCYHDKAVTVIIDFPYFSFFNRFHSFHFSSSGYGFYFVCTISGDIAPQPVRAALHPRAGGLTICKPALSHSL